MLKESSKSRFDSCSVRNSVLVISHITFRDFHVHIFSDNPSRNSCIYLVPYAPVNVKPQGNGIGHTQGDLTFWAIFMSNSLLGGKRLMSNTPFAGIHFV